MSDITPEKVAAAVCEGVGGWCHSLEAALSLTAEGNVLSADVVRWDGPDDAETVRHFRAVVVEGETVPDLAEASRLKARLDAAEWCMRQALAALEHEEALYLLNRYFAAAEAAQAQTGGAQ